MIGVRVCMKEEVDSEYRSGLYLEVGSYSGWANIL